MGRRHPVAGHWRMGRSKLMPETDAERMAEAMWIVLLLFVAFVALMFGGD